MYKVSKDISSKMNKWINDKWQNALTVIKKDAKLPFVSLCRLIKMALGRHNPTCSKH